MSGECGWSAYGAVVVCCLSPSPFNVRAAMLASSTLAMAESGASSTGPATGLAAALETRTSSPRLKVAEAAATAASVAATPAAVLMLAATPETAVWPRPRRWARAPSTLAWDREQMTTVAPSEARRAAVARPGEKSWG